MKMLYFLAKFGFIMLGSAFSASFIPPEFSVILGIAFFLGFFGLVLFGKKFREISVLFLAEDFQSLRSVSRSDDTV